MTPRGSHRRVLLALFLAALLVRLAIAGFVIAHDAQPKGDERGYLGRGLAAASVVERVFDGEEITLQDRDMLRWYGGGRWGPLYPFTLGLAFLAFDDPVVTGRLLVAVVSALTTVIVYLLTLEFSTRRAALAAAVIHLLFPGLLAFSHLLWSETFYIFFLLLGLLFALRISPADPFPRNLRFALLAGLALGLAGLVRPTVLYFLVLVPVWVAWNARGLARRLALPALFLAAAVLTLSPWIAWQTAREGHFVPLATTGSLNLFRGNRPPDISEPAARRYADEHQLDTDCVLRELAQAEISRDPAAAAARGLERVFRYVWVNEATVLSVVVAANYPPSPNGLVAAWYLTSLCALLALVALAGLGFRLQITPLGSFGNLVLLLVLVSPVSQLIMVGGNNRIAVTCLGLMIPLAGHGFAHRFELRRLRWRGLSLLAILALPILILVNLSNGFPRTTAHYLPLARIWNGMVGRPTAVLDRLELRGAFVERDDVVRIRVADDTYRLDRPDSRERVWQLTPDRQQAELLVFSQDATSPPQLVIESRNFDRSARFDPLRSDAWLHWQPTGLPGIEFRWMHHHGAKIPGLDVPETTPATVISTPACFGEGQGPT